MSSGLRRCLAAALCVALAGGGLLLLMLPAQADLLGLEPHMFTVEPVDGGTIRIQWNRKTGVEGVQIFRSGSAGGAFAMAGTAYDTAWHDTGLTAGQAYHYKLRAFRGAEVGPESAVKSAMPLDGPDVTGLSEPVYAGSEASTTVSWSGVPAAAGYELYMGAGEDYVADPLVVTAATAAVCTLPAEAGSYYFIARAYGIGDDGITYQGPFGSAILFDMAGDGLAAIPDFGVFPQNGSTVAIKWHMPEDVDGAYVYRAAAAGGPFALAGTASGIIWEDTGLTAGQRYFYKLQAFRGDDLGVESGVKACVPLDPPDILGITEGATDDYGYVHVSVSWSAVGAADGYKLCRGNEGSALYELRATTGGTSAEDMLPGAAASYWYKALAYKTYDGTVYEGPLGGSAAYTVEGVPGSFATLPGWYYMTMTPFSADPTSRRFELITPTPTRYFRVTPTPTKAPKVTPTPTKPPKVTPTPTRYFGVTPTPTKALKVTPTPTPSRLLLQTATKYVLATPTPTPTKK